MTQQVIHRKSHQYKTNNNSQQIVNIPEGIIVKSPKKSKNV